MEFNKRNTKLVVDLLTFSAYIKFINTIKVSYMHLNTKSKTCLLILYHGGNSKGTTCVVDRDVTAYLVVDRVLGFPTEQYGCRYGGYPGFNDVKVIFIGIFCYFTFRICF